MPVDGLSVPTEVRCPARITSAPSARDDAKANRTPPAWMISALSHNRQIAFMCPRGRVFGVILRLPSRISEMVEVVNHGHTADIRRFQAHGIASVKGE